MPSPLDGTLNSNAPSIAFGAAPGSAGCSSCNICIAITNHSE
ncbi:unnamed protein product, partial [Ectocarpus sp. 6 AP-2014]